MKKQKLYTKRNFASITIRTSCESARVDFVKRADTSIARYFIEIFPELEKLKLFSTKKNSAKYIIIFVLLRKYCGPFLIERILLTPSFM